MTGRESPLSAEHEALGARLVDFGGWSMPLSYPAGTIAEHLACRQGAAVFDVSHLGTVRLEGHDAFELLQQCLSNDLSRIAPGASQYSHMLDDDGCVLDDVIVWWVTKERFEVMPNASNTARVLEGLRGAGRDVTKSRALLAVQGPHARRLLSRVSPELAALARHAVAPFYFGGGAGLAAGTGYTGEDGVECALDPEVAGPFLRALVSAGAVPAGLGARDTLRLEAGLPLYGHELGPQITPLEAGLGFVVGWEKKSFRGREALLERRDAGPPLRRLRGLLGDTSRPLRDGWQVLGGGGAGESAGEVTSGNYSPCLRRGIALGYLDAALADGDAVDLGAPSGRLAARVVRPPFVELPSRPGRGREVQAPA